MTGERPIHWLRDALVIVVFVALILLVAAVVPPLLQPERLEATLRTLKGIGPLFAIPIIVLEVVIAPIPGGAIPIVLGSVYGPWLGTLYAWIGNVLGSLLAFWLARRFGRPLVARLTRGAHLERYDRFLERHRHGLWAFYVLPVFPVDLVSFALGVSRYPPTAFAILVVLAFIPHQLILALFGDQLARAEGSGRWLLAALAVVFLVVASVVARRFERRTNASPPTDVPSSRGGGAPAPRSGTDQPRSA